MASPPLSAAVASWPVDRIPTEVTVEIVLFAEFTLSEFIDFTNLCSAFRQLRGERNSWLDALINQQDLELPLTCPLGTDFFKLSFEELKSIGLQSQRLFYSWYKRDPLLVESSTKKVFYDLPRGLENPLPAKILSVVPNSPLVVLYRQDDAALHYEMQLYDTESRDIVCHHTFGAMLGYSSYDGSHHHIIATATHVNNDRFCLCVFAVMLGNGKGGTASFKVILNENRHQFSTRAPRKLLIHRDIVATVAWEFDIFLEVTNLTDHRITRWRLRRRDHSFVNPPPRKGLYEEHISRQANLLEYLDCFIVRDNFVFVTERPPQQIAAHWQIADIQRLASLKLNNSSEGCYDMPIFHRSFSSRGLQLLTITSTEKSGSPSVSTRFNSWYLSPDSLSVTNKCVIIHKSKVQLVMTGRNVGSHGISSEAPQLLASSRSGLYKVMIVYPNEPFDPENAASHPSLILVRFGDSVFKRGLSACRLNIPHGIQLDEVYSIAMDERQGVVYMSLVTGWLVAISYL